MTNPLVFRFGFALAISIAGFAVVYRRSRTRRLPSRPRSFSGAESPSVCKSAVIGLKELRLLNGVTTAFTKVVTSTSTITTSITTTRTTTSSFLFFEFDRKKSENQEDGAMQEEITKLRNQVWSLQENERGLELQLLEYYGMQEQEAAVRELENQIKINSVQAKLNSLKIESLLTDNQKLRAQLIDYSRAVNELEAAKGAIKLLDREEKATSLKRRIETKDDEEIARRVNRMEELEFEIAKLNCMNSRLSEENLDLTRKLELVQASASGEQKGIAVEEANKTRECNENLINEIEQMKTDRCADVEQLVYLKWVNACLRYELRNYQPPHGRMGAKDLSKNLSPRSEKMAKQLILEYGNGDADEKSLSCIEFDSEDSYSSPASTADLEESSSSSRHGNSKRKKFLSKLKRLVLSKHNNNYHKVVNADRAPISPSSSGRRVSFSVSSIDDMIGRDSCCSLSPSMTEEHSPANQSVDSQTYNEKDESFKGEAGTPSRFQRMAPGDDAATDQRNTPEKAEIKKLATALSESRDDFKFNRTSHWN
ncbi:protein CHUP1, chloroplastic-like [Zingiber officinale]|uniref:Protein CHUP1, chloroplastic n=1 Tax=Zingiber officinale TaxID=94328 RepID=A0A8J5FAG8_ZINOF|nr:protein CHUP1, chloroplastic-like [Zingiber officinale]KAG6482303.1 hypothetical protein ZIOFF_058934 [Zingiber officinale]